MRIRFIAQHNKILDNVWINLRSATRFASCDGAIKRWIDVVVKPRVISESNSEEQKDLWNNDSCNMLSLREWKSYVSFGIRFFSNPWVSRGKYFFQISAEKLYGESEKVSIDYSNVDEFQAFAQIFENDWENSRNLGMNRLISAYREVVNIERGTRRDKRKSLGELITDIKCIYTSPLCEHFEILLLALWLWDSWSLSFNAQNTRTWVSIS